MANNKTAINKIKEILEMNGFVCHIVSTMIDENASNFGYQLAILIETILMDKSGKRRFAAFDIANADLNYPEAGRTFFIPLFIFKRLRIQNSLV